MTVRPDPQVARARYEHVCAELVGRRISQVTYWHLHGFGNGPPEWDFGDWHHAEVEVELLTDAGPYTVTWTPTFDDYGIEILREPAFSASQLSTEQPPEFTRAEGHPRWLQLLSSPVREAAIYWETVTRYPTVSFRDGVPVVENREDVRSVPFAQRLDFDDGPVWMLAAIPPTTSDDQPFMGADEVLVVFTAERMLRFGFPDGAFVRSR